MKTFAQNACHAFVGTIAACALASAGCDPTSEADGAAELEAEAAELLASAKPPVKYLASLPGEAYGEKALARIFSQGTVDHVPVGEGAGYPVLFNKVTDLNWLAGQLWGGKTFKIVSSATQPNGDPTVCLDNKIIQTPFGEILNLFDACVVRTKVSDLTLGVNDKGETVRPPSGLVGPVHLSFLEEPIAVDNKESVLLNYFEDRTIPVIRRVLDEVREVDAVNCPGLYLGRAHVRRCTSLSCGEAYSPLLDFPEYFTTTTRYEWKFWTYFLLDFGQGGGSCDLAPLIAGIEASFQAEGIDAQLPAPPAAQ